MRRALQLGTAHLVAVQAEFRLFVLQRFYVAKRSASPAAVIAGISALGALPVLAHPGVTQVDDLIGDMVEAGLAGIEAYHADHTAEQTARYAALADVLGLLVTGGTDFHGPQAPNPDVGAIELPVTALEAFLAAGEALTRS